MDKTKELQTALKDKFLSQSKFSAEIEKIVKDDNLNYIEAIVQYCEINKVELDIVPKLLSKPLKERLKFDAIQLNFLQRSSKAKLPI
jgi:hypothetical protein